MTCSQRFRESDKVLDIGRRSAEKRYEQPKAPGLHSSRSRDKNEVIVHQRRDMSGQKLLV